MIPAAFEYVAPTSVQDALVAMGEAGDEGKILAGGQSLIPILRMRLNAPEKIIDLGRIESLRGIREDGDDLVIGAMTSHAEIAGSALVAEHAAVLAAAVKTVADAQVRHRGTIGGALVHADPAGDYGAPILALDADLVITGTGGERTVAATDFFEDLFTTAVGEDEILTAIRLRKQTGCGGAYEKFVRVSHQWSIVAVAASVCVEGNTLTRARIGLTNMGSTPLRARAAEAALEGVSLEDASALAAACAMAAEGTNPPADLNGDAAYRRHLAGVLTRRAVLAAARG